MVGRLLDPQDVIKADVMSPIDHVNLNKWLECNRENYVVVSGEKIPGSIAILNDMLSDETRPYERDEIYGHLLLESQIVGSSYLECKYAEARHREFPDAFSLMAYSSALIRGGNIEKGISAAKVALNSAIEDGKFINDTAVNYIRDALKTNSVEYMNESIRLLIISLDAPRTEDCRLETDWVESAVRLGVDPALIAKIRERT